MGIERWCKIYLQIIFSAKCNRTHRKYSKVFDKITVLLSNGFILWMPLICYQIFWQKNRIDLIPGKLISFSFAFLIQFKSMFHFYTPWKHQINLWLSDVFRGYLNGTLAWNWLIKYGLLPNIMLDILTTDFEKTMFPLKETFNVNIKIWMSIWRPKLHTKIFQNFRKVSKQNALSLCQIKDFWTNNLKASP